MEENGEVVYDVFDEKSLVVAKYRLASDSKCKGLNNDEVEALVAG